MRLDMAAGEGPDDPAAGRPEPGRLRDPSAPVGGYDQLTPPDESSWTAVTPPARDASPWPEERPLRGWGDRRRTRLRIAGLVLLVAIVTVAGVLIGKAIDSGSGGGTSSGSKSTTPARPHPAPPRFGSLPAVASGRLPAATTPAAAATAGPDLVVVATKGAVYAGRPGSTLRRVGKVPAPLTAAAALPIGGKVVVVGGAHGAKPTDAVLTVNRRTGKVTRSGTFIEPLAEAGTAAGAGGAYLVGGWTGTKYATAVLRFVQPDGEELVARLPAGVRSPAVALVGRRLYVAGGRTKAGLSRKLFVVDTRTGTVRTLPNLPVPVQRAVLVVRPAARKSGAARLYLLGGVTANGRPSTRIVAIDPSTGRATAAGTLRVPLPDAVAVPVGSRTFVTGADSGTIYRVG